MQSRSARVGIAVAWAALVIGWTLHLRATGRSPAEWLQGAVDAASGSWWAVPAYVVAYLLRPLVLFPATLLTVAAGILFGSVAGVPVALAAATASALVAYAVGTTLTPTAIRHEAAEATLLERWSGRLRNESFVTVFVLRLAYVPYDLVNYAAGFLRIDVRSFAGATALGSLPGTVAFVLAGASLGRLDTGLAGFDGRVFAASVVIFVVSVAMSRVLRRRQM